MSTFLIGYDLNTSGQNYDGLIKEIKALGSWWHCLDSTWLVKCNSTYVTVRNHLQQFIDSNDELLVIDVTGDSAAWIGFDDECANWLRQGL